MIKSIFLLLFIPVLLLSQNSGITWQGLLQDNSGKNLNGNYNITFKLYETQNGGSTIWAESHFNLPIADGIANVNLGSITPLNLSFQKNYWLEITIGNDSPMPRIALTSVPYSFHSKTADSLVGKYNETDPSWEGANDTSGTIFRNGMVGIGTNNPSATLEINNFGSGSGNVLLKGEYKFSNQSDLPINGIGTSLLWYPDKAAFRVGYLESKYWNKDSIGLWSFASGFNNVSKKIGSVALGIDNSVNADYAAAIGYFNFSAGAASMAFGYYNTITGTASIALGYFNKTIGNYSSSIGSSNQSTGINSTTIGSSNNATGDYSLALGDSTSATARYSTTFGKNTKAQAEYSTAFGFKTVASGVNSTAFGYNCTASGKNSVAHGEMSVASGYASTSLGLSVASGDFSFSGGECISSGEKAFAYGSSNVAEGYGSVCFGSTSVAAGMVSVSMGTETKALGEYSIALGYSSKASGFLSTSIGSVNLASGEYSFAIGNGASAKSSYESVFGSWNRDYSPLDSINWNSSDRLFVIGNGYNYLNKSNALTILKNGKMGLQSVTNPTFALELPNNSMDGVGKGRAYAWTTYSDGRLKTDRTEISYGLAEIMKIRPLSYFHHNSIFDNGKLIISNEGENSFGFIAQDFYKIIPELVSKPENEERDLWSINYSQLTPVLVKAIQEQQAIIDVQNKKIEELERKFELLLQSVNKK